MAVGRRMLDRRRPGWLMVVVVTGGAGVVAAVVIVVVRKERLLVEREPVAGDLEHDLGVDPARLGGLLDCEAGLLEHVVALVVALLDGALDLVGVERAGAGEHGEGEVGAGTDHRSLPALRSLESNNKQIRNRP